MTTSQLMLLPEKDYLEDAEVVCYKNVLNIDTAVIESLEERLDRISVLKLEFCNLTEHQIEILANLLVKNHSISEVSVNGNPNGEQNFHLLIHGTNILALSLKFCSIDSKGIEKISNELYYPFESCLLHLNLASNLICNQGIEHVERFLRINRTLISLNLADNKIYDIGCIHLMLTLQQFPLNEEEMIIRRRIRFEILRKNMNFTNDLLKHHTSLRSSKRLTSKGSSLISQTTITADKIKNNSTKFSLLNHPFIQDPHEEKEVDDIYCQGNDTLINLNLSYNKITREGLNCMIAMLHYQINNYGCDRGISRISTEGNDFQRCQNILNKLKELIGAKTKRYITTENKKKSHLNLRKRS